MSTHTSQFFQNPNLLDEVFDITATVKDKYNNLQYAADVYLIWRSGPTRINQSVPGTGATGKGENGEYTYKITPNDMPSAAPDNITIAAKSPGLNQWGYTSIKMKRMNNIIHRIICSCNNF